ncbi:MAG: UDP-N-acetylmuramoyl-tripeptide--D-alanyl-D-alanine ligase [Pseudomonadota bacterium]
MSVLWTASDAAAATGGTLSGADWRATGVSIDTRSLVPGDLFVALTATRDGHDFVGDALANGAAAALVSRRPQGVPTDAPLLMVDDVQAGLEGLGHAGRKRCTGRVVAVTGSAGKTTTKDMLRTALAEQGPTHASVESYNNHWGVPLTLARMPATTKYAIIEIGMNAPGEIAPLARMAAPHVAIVTTVAAAHLEAFDSIDGIAREKASIFEGLLPDGIAILNGDLPTTGVLLQAAQARAGRIVQFGARPGLDVTLDHLEMPGQTTVARATVHGAELVLKLAQPGQHLAMNALAVLAAVEAVGADVARALLALGHWQGAAGRGLRETVTLHGDDDETIGLIDDAFNANPASVAAAFEVLAAADLGGRGRRIAVLGDMLELGPDAPRLHADLAQHPGLARIDVVHTAGTLMAHLHEALPLARRGMHCDTADTLSRQIPKTLRAGDLVLVKGSKSSNMTRVVETLRRMGQRAEARE